MSKISLSLLIAAAVLVPGSSEPVTAQQTKYIRFATLAPRTSSIMREFKRMSAELKDITDGSWGIKLYASGVAGDERDVIQKMKVGQMDATGVTTFGMGSILREIEVLNAPGLITTYAELEAVQKAMSDEWSEKFLKKGFKVLAWGDVGKIRLFSKAPIRHPNDLKQMRPWIWSQSYTMQEFYRQVGATGVRLTVPEVYGALQTNMINAVAGSALTFASFQWHKNLSHVTKETTGVISTALIINNDKWKTIPADQRAKIEELFASRDRKQRDRMRRDDKRAYLKLRKRGYTATEFTPQGAKAFDRIEKSVREKMTGRVWSKQLLEKVQEIAAKAK